HQLRAASPAGCTETPQGIGISETALTTRARSKIGAGNLQLKASSIAGRAPGVNQVFFLKWESNHVTSLDRGSCWFPGAGGRRVGGRQGSQSEDREGGRQEERHHGNDR